MLVLLVINLLPGCGQSDIKTFIKNTEKSNGVVDPLPVLIKFKRYQYSASNLRSPFGEPAHTAPVDLSNEANDTGILGDIGGDSRTDADNGRYTGVVGDIGTFAGQAQANIQNKKANKTANKKPASVSKIHDTLQVHPGDVILLQPNPERGRKKMYLEQFDLGVLKYVGNMNIKNYSWALVLDPKGELHHLQVGDYLGQKDGKITQILDQKIVIRELYITKQGAWDELSVDVNLTLKPKDKDNKDDQNTQDVGGN